MMGKICSVLPLFMLFPITFAAGLSPGQATALVTLVALKLALKSGLGYNHGMVLGSFQGWTPREKSSVVFLCFFFFFVSLCARYLYYGIASFLMLCCDYIKC